MVWAWVITEVAGEFGGEGLVDWVAKDFGPGSEFVAKIDGVIEFGGLIEFSGLIELGVESIGCSRRLGLNEFSRFEFELLIGMSTVESN
ncbi:hypothetical protein U1Q18_021024 [Sarracenia purpurea var. burkii]